MTVLDASDFISFGHFVIRKDDIGQVSATRHGAFAVWYSLEVRNRQNQWVGTVSFRGGPWVSEEGYLIWMQKKAFGCDLGIRQASKVTMANRVSGIVWAGLGLLRFSALPGLLRWLLGR